jgi:hypothetical protein
LNDELSELESSSRRHGYEVVKPPTLQGRSGVLHSFSLLISNGGRLFAVDIYEDLDVSHILTSFIKIYDTGVSCCLLSVGKQPAKEALSLADTYRMRIFKTTDLEELVTNMSEGGPPR